ncbi:MAG: hypothetical protein EZS28_042282 [Streblomastix strix]|uniref:Uncharacterized protein n=1 Tax=Streblomastix strix TaxID=222440 RepID=A0A5J4TX37_9EUKA|nr:MAG: hypothetical protein EZS28_042282 [Streblomastix strix]
MAHKIYKLAINFGFIYERKDRDKNNDERITYVQEKTLIDTKEKYVAVYSICAITYLLPISGKPIPSLKIHIRKKRQCLRYINSPYPNTCVLEAIA